MTLKEFIALTDKIAAKDKEARENGIPILDHKEFHRLRRHYIKLNNKKK